jgi:hypothetical protein
MAKTRIDLNRFKKVYPLQRKSPSNFNKSHEVYSALINFLSEQSKSVVVERSGVISTAPIVTITPENDNVNVWISGIARSIPTDATSDWKVTVVASTSWTGKVHVLLAEVS